MAAAPPPADGTGTGTSTATGATNDAKTEPSLKTEPSKEVYFNAPFIIPQNTCIRLTNTGSFVIGWRFKSTDIKRFSVSPISGSMRPKESKGILTLKLPDTFSQVDRHDDPIKVLDILCNPFDYEQEEDLTQDRLTIETVQAPNPYEKYNREWFKSGKHTQRSVLPVCFNL